MGLVRFLLAAAVVFQHSTVPWNLPVVDGHQAVRLFYMISGFYMALILERKYPATRQGIWLFYSNRALRIFPIYWLVLAVAGLFYAAAWVGLGRIPERLGWYGPLLEAGHGMFLTGLGVSQLTLFGLDWFNCFDFQGASLAWGGTVPEGRAVGFLCLVPQAWTLAVELSFYLLAPWITRWRTGWITLLGAAGFLVRAVLWMWRPMETGSLTYFWFPLQLPFFFLGILSYRWMRVSESFWKRPALAVAAKITVLGLLVGYGRMPDAWDQAISCGVLALFIPGLFAGESRWQTRVGELSYPIYIVHILVKWIFLAAQGVEQTGQTEISGLLLLGGSLFASLVIDKTVGAGLEEWRQRRALTLG